MKDALNHVTPAMVDRSFENWKQDNSGYVGTVTQSTKFRTAIEHCLEEANKQPRQGNETPEYHLARIALLQGIQIGTNLALQATEAKAA